MLIEIGNVRDMKRYYSKISSKRAWPFCPYLHDPDVIGTVDLRVLGELLAKRGHRTLQVLPLAGVLLLNVSVHARSLRL